MAEPRDDVLAAWQAAGTDELMLPTGTEVRVMLPGPGAMARHGLTPGALRGIVGRLTGEINQGGMSDDDWAAWEASVNILICDTVIEVRPPGRELFEAWTIRPADLAERRLPPVDHDALVTLVMRLDSADRIDARSRAALSGTPAMAAARARARHVVATLPDWMSFVESDEGMLCALTARTFGQRPSALLNIADPVIGYAVDEALMLRLALTKPDRQQPLTTSAYERPEIEPYDPAVAAAVQDAHLERLRAEGKLRTH